VLTVSVLYKNRGFVYSMVTPRLLLGQDRQLLSRSREVHRIDHLFGLVSRQKRTLFSLRGAVPAQQIMNIPDSLDCYWVEAGRLLAGEYPGAYDREMARENVRALLHLGIRVFVDLTEADEGVEPYEEVVEDEALGLGVTAAWTRFPIPDMHVPTPEGMREILDAISRTVDAGSPVYVHCLGGIGRTGTVVGCWLVERGVAGDGDEVFARLARLREEAGLPRHRSPETSAQYQFVREWIAATSAGGPSPAT